MSSNISSGPQLELSTCSAYQMVSNSGTLTSKGCSSLRINLSTMPYVRIALIKLESASLLEKVKFGISSKLKLTNYLLLDLRGNQYLVKIDSISKRCGVAKHHVIKELGNKTDEMKFINFLESNQSVEARYTLCKKLKEGIPKLEKFLECLIADAKTKSSGKNEVNFSTENMNDNIVNLVFPSKAEAILIDSFKSAYSKNFPAKDAEIDFGMEFKMRFSKNNDDIFVIAFHPNIGQFNII